jgi:hypothetical protein
LKKSKEKQKKPGISIFEFSQKEIQTIVCDKSWKRESQKRERVKCVKEGKGSKKS